MNNLPTIFPADLSLQQIFSGQYQFHRTVFPQNLIAQGNATFQRLSHFLTFYQETGTYQNLNQEQHFYQSRFFVFELQKFSIYTFDCQLLHHFSLDFTEARPCFLTHTHLCGEDKYSLILCIDDASRFSTHYMIQGPRKNYRIQTDFFRN